jgi:predicted metalloprotease
MRWEDNRESDNVEDRRDDSGGGGGMGFGGIHLGLGGIIIVVLGSWLFGITLRVHDSRQHRRCLGRDLRALRAHL